MFLPHHYDAWPDMLIKNLICKDSNSSWPGWIKGQNAKEFYTEILSFRMRTKDQWCASKA